jgi:hypothetical protein
MLHLLHSLMPHIPRNGFVAVFVVVILSNIGASLAAKNDCFWDRVYVGGGSESAWWWTIHQPYEGQASQKS